MSSEISLLSSVICHLANLVADEYRADAVRVARPQVGGDYFASCHKYFFYLFPFALLCLLGRLVEHTGETSTSPLCSRDLLQLQLGVADDEHNASCIWKKTRMMLMLA